MEDLLLDVPRGTAHDHPRVAPGRGFGHEVLLHGDGADGFVRQTMPLIEQAIESRAPVLIAVSPDRIAGLREALGTTAARVALTDIRRLGANPARIIPAWRRFLRTKLFSDGGEPLGIGEPVWQGRSTAELDECWRYEALLNLAFGGDGRPWRLLCPYDFDSLDDHVIEAARICHPLISERGRAHLNNCYRNPAQPFDGTLEEPPAEAYELEFTEAGLGDVRHRLASWALLEGLPSADIADLVLAVDEIATNSIRHGGGSGRLRMWRSEGSLLCEVRDDGEMRDPLLGRVQPGGEAICGRGMWIVNQLCDLVQIRSSAAGSQIRLHKHLA
jgi:anti-sigma regulatory factor (Ser/Thr protein kinase)